MEPPAKSDRGVLRKFAASAEQRRQAQLRQSLSETWGRERAIHQQREQVTESLLAPFCLPLSVSRPTLVVWWRA